MEKVIIDSKYLGKRIDKCLIEILKGYDVDIPSRSFLQNLIGKGVLVNGKTVKRSHKFKEGDVLEIDKKFFVDTLAKVDSSSRVVGQKGDLDIVFENDNYIVLNKPKGLVVHPGVGNGEGTLANYVRGYLEEKDEYDNLMDRGGIVHRLDKGVSGLMVVAKNKEMQDFLKQQFQDHEVEKLYIVETEKFQESELDTLNVVRDISLKEGINIDENWITLQGYIGRSSKNRFRMIFKSYEFGGSKLAISHFLKIGEERYFVKIDTGRMHQIRATLFHLGRTVIGDSLYTPGTRQFTPDSISLESVYLSFKDLSGEKKIFSTYSNE